MTVFTRTVAPGNYSLTGTAVTMTVASTGADTFTKSSDMLVLVQNTNAGAQTVTITSTADSKTSRTGNVAAQSLAAGEIRCFRLIPNGWANAAGSITITGSHADVKIGIIKL